MHRSLSRTRYVNATVSNVYDLSADDGVPPWFAGIQVEVACLTADNVRSATPSWIQPSAACPAACTTAWNALIDTCPGHTKSWTLGGECSDSSGVTEEDCTGQWSDTATDWVKMYVAGDGTGDAYSVAARVMLKWIELGLAMDTCELSSPVCDPDGCHSTEEAVATRTCGIMQRLAQYSALSSPATQQSPTQGLGCESTCSATCQAIEDATWGIGSGACCSSGTAADGSDCTDVSADLGAANGILLLDYTAMRAVYSASAACETFTCSTETLAGAFCSQTAGSMGTLMCLDSLKLRMVSSLLPDGYDVPAEIRSCLDELANNGRCANPAHKSQAQCTGAGETWTPAATSTSEMTVKQICATSSSPCPGDDVEADDVEAKPSSSAVFASNWRVILVAVASYGVWACC